MRKRVVTRDKPFRSKLAPYEAEIKDLRSSGESIRGIAAQMAARHNLDVSHNAVASFLRTHSIMVRRSFLDGITETRKAELLKQLRAVWTHDSTAIEGNTLSLGDTMAVLEYGLTVKGKSFRDHQDVVSHARGVDFVQSLIAEGGKLTLGDICALHRTVMGEGTRDIYQPVGEWKREDNGTYGVEDGKSVYMPYASANDTPELMAKWLKEFNARIVKIKTEDDALEAYLFAHASFVRIHPFFDGNGRVARLVANIPVLVAGYPPIVIPAEARLDYIGELWKYQRAVGVICRKQSELMPQPEKLDALRNFIREWWRTTLDLVAEAKK